MAVKGWKMGNATTVVVHWNNKELKSVTGEVLDYGLTSMLPVVLKGLMEIYMWRLEPSKYSIKEMNRARTE